MSREIRHQQAREATRRAILDAALELFVADGTRRSRFGTSQRRSSTAPARSTVTFRRRTTSSSPWPKKDFGCSAPPISPAGHDQSGPRSRHDRLADLRVQRAPSGVFRSRVPRPPRAADRTRVQRFAFMADSRAVCWRACNAASTRRSFRAPCTRLRVAIAVGACPRHRFVEGLEPAGARRGRRSARPRCHQHDHRRICEPAPPRTRLRHRDCGSASVSPR